MAVQLTPLGKAVLGTLKWLVVPLLAYGLGVKCIGPNILTPKEDPAVKRKQRPQMPPKSETGKDFQDIRNKGKEKGR